MLVTGVSGMGVLVGVGVMVGVAVGWSVGWGWGCRERPLAYLALSWGQPELSPVQRYPLPALSAA